MAIQEIKDKDGKTIKYRVQRDIGLLPNGKRDRPTKICKTMKEAQKEDARLLMLKEVGKGSSNRVKFGEFVDSFWLPEKKATLRKNTIQGYERDLRLRLRPAFWDLLLTDITKLRIQSMIDRCPTYKTAKNARDTLSAILGYAVDMEVLSRNPAAAKFKYKAVDTVKDNGAVSTSHKEHLDIISMADTYEVRAILVFGLCFGLRKGEIMALDWGKHIDFKNRKVYIRKTFTRSIGAPELTPPKTPRSVRDLPMNDTTYRLLEGLRDWGGISRVTGAVLVFNGHRMNPETAYRRLKAFVDSHNDLPRLTTSNMRHCFATAWVVSGGNVASLSKWLGHTNVSTTLNRYVVPLMGDLQDDAERMDSLYQIAVSL
ncbi:MAG: site-specific integrase [Coriobacteriia bacterium]|nr:site-specific integrase [Coriobacteriia bacterium]